MPYATQQDLEDRFGQDEILALTDFDRDDAVDAQTLTLAQSDTDAEIDGYLADRYAVPLASVPQRLVQVACDIVRFRLYRHDVPDDVQRLYDSAVDWLKGVAAGKWPVPGLTEKASASSAGMPQVSAGDRVFTRDELSGF